MTEAEPYQDNTIPKRIAIVSNIAMAVIAVSIVVLAYLGVLPFQSEYGLYRVLPGNILLEMVFIWIISFVVAVGVFYVTPKVASLVIEFHKRLSGGVYDYYFQVRDKERENSRHFGKLIIPALTTLGLSFTLMNMTGMVDLFFNMDNFNGLPEAIMIPLSTSVPFIFGVILFATLIPIIFAASWLLEDLGVICVRRNRGTGMTVDIEGVGNWYIALLKGFAMISAMLAYFFMFVQMITWYQMLPVWGADVPVWYYFMILLIVILSPLLAIGPVSVSYLLYNMTEAKDRVELREMLVAKGLKHVRIDVVEVE